jgi:hypothetical protein
MIYDTTHFTNQGVVGPITIDRMRFRAANNNTAAGGTYSNCNISIGTSATDYLTPSTTFATNRGTMQAVLTAGTVTCAAGAGTTPNNYVIDITIPGGFVYDPTLGQDLLIEVDAPAPVPTTIPTMATGVSAAAQRSNRVSQNSTTATTGTLSGFASVVLFDISGGPGGIPVIAVGTNTTYGQGCYEGSRAFGELFPIAAANLDLGTGLTLTPDVPGAPTRYLATATAGAFVPPSGTVPLLSNATTPAVMTDDATSVACNLTGWSFPTSGGSYTTLHATTNGEILFGATTATGSDFSPSLADMVGGTATHATRNRLFPCWYDFFANRNVSLNVLAGVHFSEDPVAQTATFTWNDVGELATAAAGAKSFNFQVVLSADGTIEIRYGSMSTFGSTAQAKIVGYSPGAPVRQPIPVDLSAAMPFLSRSTDVAGLTLAAAPAPLLGATVNLTTNNISAAGIGVNFLSLTQINPGFDLAIIDMPGCNAYVNPDIGSAIVGTPTAVTPFSIPNSLGLVGQVIYSQSFAFDLSFPNLFGAVTSNGVAMTIGTVGG